MKTILWATLTANGNYQRNDATHPPRPEALADFAAHVRETGNFVVGRHTFEMFSRQQQPSAEGPARAPDGGGLGSPTIVVVTRSDVPPGVLRAKSPEDALALLRERGFSKALVGGGAALHNAFLAADLVDELVVDVAPELEDEGLKLHLPKGRHRTPALTETKSLGGGVVQLRYDLRAR